MANKRHLSILRQGAEAWNAWKKQHTRTIPDFSGASLLKADLYRADLYRADLSGASLHRANLYGATLTEATLSGANLTEAILTGAYLTRANLTGANLTGADLSVASLIEAYLHRANLYGADLYGADLYGADFYGANLYGADLTHTIARQTHFDNIDLSTVKGLETITHLGPSSISTSTLERSHGDIPEAFLRGAGLSDTFISYVRSLTNNSIQYYTCFLSYSSKDQDFADRLHADLQSKSIRCWYAPQDMHIGDKIKPRIDECIRLYDKLLVVLSQHSIQSEWVAYEVEQALNKEPRGTPNVLYPIRLDDTILTCHTQWARDIQDTHHIGDFMRWKNHDAYQHSFKRLLSALKQKQPPEKALDTSQSA